MTYQESMMTTKENLVESIEDLLGTDLHFLRKLDPRELAILAISLRGMTEWGKIDLKDQGRKSIDS